MQRESHSFGICYAKMIWDNTYVTRWRVFKDVWHPEKVIFAMTTDNLTKASLIKELNFPVYNLSDCSDMDALFNSIIEYFA